MNKKSILLVEDETIIAMSQSFELKNHGYNVVTVNNGEEAINKVFESDSIDLILMDIDLGKGLDGTEAAAEILSKKNIPIIFLSSHTEHEIVAKTEKITSYGYVVKNSGITVLDASIKMAFKLFDANKKILESENRYRALFDQAMDGIAFVSEEGETVAVNNSFAQIHGYENADLMINLKMKDIQTNESYTYYF